MTQKMVRAVAADQFTATYTNNRVGVSSLSTYEIERIDSDYFSEDL